MFKKVQESIGSIVALIVILICAVIAYQFYTGWAAGKTAQADAERAKQVIGITQNSNSALKQVHVINSESGKITDRHEAESAAEKVAEDAKQTAAYVKSEDKVKVIKKEFATKIDASSSPVAAAELIKKREVTVSEERMQLIWDNYCRTLPNDADCRSATP